MRIYTIIMSLEEIRRHQTERKRNILYLITQYLSDFGLHVTHDTLCREANLTVNYRVCDNVDLDTIYLDYCSHYQMKFDKQPKIIKKIDCTDGQQHGDRLKIMRTRKKNTIDVSGKSELNDQTNLMGEIVNNSISLVPIIKSFQNVDDTNDHNQNAFCVSRNLRDFLNVHSEFQELAEILFREIVQRKQEIQWSDIKGNDDIKQLLYDTVVMPLNYPDLFKGIIKPWRTILMHGPSGTGKTLLARALCSEIHGRVTFFNVAASTVTSKWRGDSEKFVRVLFEMAKFYSPAVIFFDEIESLTSKRDSLGEHEASRRFKNEFLTQIDGLDYEDVRVLLLANTNLPWEIDVAFLRRFERKILVDLPCEKDRMSIIEHFVSDYITWSIEQKDELAIITKGLTGAEIKIACKEIFLNQIGRMTQKENPAIIKKILPITYEDVKMALGSVKPAMTNMSVKHLEWSKKLSNN